VINGSVCKVLHCHVIDCHRNARISSQSSPERYAGYAGGVAAEPSGEGFHGRGHGRIEEEEIEELVVLIANASMVLDGSKWQVETYIMI